MAAAGCLFLAAANLHAQESAPPAGGFGAPQGNFDPAQMRQRMMDRMREQFDVQDNAEWQAISDRIAKVMDARRALGGLGGGGGGPGMGLAGGPPPGGGPPPAEPGAGGQNQRQFRPGPGGFNREPAVELTALRKAVDAKAPAAEIKAKLAELRAARKAKEAALEQAQEDLRQILSARQEAVAVMAGLLK